MYGIEIKHSKKYIQLGSYQTFEYHDLVEWTAHKDLKNTTLFTLITCLEIYVTHTVCQDIKSYQFCQQEL